MRQMLSLGCFNVAESIFHAMLVRLQKGTQSVENSVAGSYEVKLTLTLRLRNSHSRVFEKRCKRNE